MELIDYGHYYCKTQRVQGNAAIEVNSTGQALARERPLVPYFDDDILASDPDVGRHSKRRKGKRNSQKAADVSGKKKATHANGSGEVETIDISGNLGGSNCNDSTEVGHSSQMPGQLSLYTGANRDLMDRARQNFHIFLLTLNGFPNTTDTKTWTALAYKHAGMFLYGDKYKGK